MHVDRKVVFCSSRTCWHRFRPASAFGSTASSPQLASCRSAAAMPARASRPPSKAGTRTPDGSFTPAHRIFQSQPRRDARHPGRPEQPHRARRSRPGPADALPAAAAVGRLHDQGAEGLRRQAPDVDDHRQRPDQLDTGRRHQGLSGRAVQGGGAKKRAAAPAVRSEGPGIVRAARSGIAATLNGGVGQPVTSAASPPTDEPTIPI